MSKSISLDRERVLQGKSFKLYQPFIDAAAPDPMRTPVFKQLDKNQSGFLTMREFNNAMRLLHISCQKEDAEAVFKLFDSNADGRLSYPEFYRGMLRDLDFQELMAMAEVQRKRKEEEAVAVAAKQVSRPRAATLPIMRSRTKSEGSETPSSPLPTPKVGKTRTEVSLGLKGYGGSAQPCRRANLTHQLDHPTT